MRLKLTILGANGPYPGADGACSGYLVEGGGAALMLDAGSGALARLMGRLPLTELDAAVLSHLHYDHMSDMLPMLYALGFSGRSQPLRTIAPHTPEAARALLNHPALAVEEPTETAVKGLKLTFAPARHPIEAYMISVEGDGRRLAFTGDAGNGGQVGDFEQWVGGCLQPDQAGGGAQFPLDRREVAHVGVRKFQSVGFEHLFEQPVGAAVGVVGQQDVIAGLAQRTGHHVLGREPRGERQPGGCGV